MLAAGFGCVSEGFVDDSVLTRSSSLAKGVEFILSSLLVELGVRPPAATPPDNMQLPDERPPSRKTTPNGRVVPTLT